MTTKIIEPRIIAECALCEIPMCSAKIKPPRAAWFSRHMGRGLCTSCYGLHRRQGTLDRFDRRIRPREDTYQEWQLLKSTGVTRAEAARRMGITVAALDGVRYRMAARQGVSLRELDRL